MIIGITISLAGNPNIKASNIIPSSPIMDANGFNKLAECLSKVILFILILAMIQIIAPAGRATSTALPRINKVLSNMDLIITFIICGFLYGGSSKVNDDGTPFNIVFDNILEIKKVINILNNMIIINIDTLIIDDVIELENGTKNIVIRAIIVGNLPLQGIKLLVIIASNFSLFESIILVPVTPTELQPKPIHIVNACLPQDEHFSNILSKLKAILGRYPKSSNNVNNGKNIAIGGSITDITQASTLYIPNTNIFDITFGIFIKFNDA